MNFHITPRKVRFSIVGSTATTIDFIILIISTSLGMPFILANYISTSVAFIYNYIASKKFAFKTRGRGITRELILFFIVTLFGIWVIQPAIIWVVTPFAKELSIHGWIFIVTTKLIASLATFVWNYLFYTRLVFKNSPRGE